MRGGTASKIITIPETANTGPGTNCPEESGGEIIAFTRCPPNVRRLVDEIHRIDPYLFHAVERILIRRL